MLCLKCGTKETLQYSERCEDCEKNDQRFIWINFGILILFIIFTGFEWINSIMAGILMLNLHYEYLLPFIIFKFISKLTLIILASYMVFLFFKRKKKIISTCMILLIVNFIFYLIELALTYFIYDQQLSAGYFLGIGKILFYSVLFITYFLLSEKVKLVFIN